jgi:hypothetical protein
LLIWASKIDRCVAEICLFRKVTQLVVSQAGFPVLADAAKKRSDSVKNVKFILAAVAVAILGGTMAARADSVVFSQGFETGTAGWSAGSGYGTIQQVSSGTNSIAASQGGAYAVVNSVNPDNGPYTFFGSKRSSWSGGWTASLDIYLDPSWQNGQGFDYSVAASNSSGGYMRDFIFHVSETGEQLLVNADNNSGNKAPAPALSVTDSGVISGLAGWYTFTSQFHEVNGLLAGTLSVSKGSDVLFSKTLSASKDTISSAGGNDYGWFTFVNVGPNGLAIDNTQLSVVAPVPLPAAAWAGFSMLGGFGMLAGLRKRLSRKSRIA